MTAPTLDEQKSYWKYWQRTRTVSEYARQRSESVLDLLRALRLDSPRILDLGCGTGWFTEQLTELGVATGLDLNDEAMDEAQRRRPDITFIGGDVFNQRLEAGSYDVVVSLQVVAHVIDQSGFMRRIAELLAPGGYLVISTNNRFVMNRLGSADGGSHQSMGHIEKWLSTRQFKALVADYFDVLRVWTVTPVGNGGILRFVNSAKVTSLLAALLTPDRVRRLKERLGLGYTTLILARNRE